MASITDFKPGDLVTLLGGAVDSPQMTVERVRFDVASGRVDCVWFDNKDRLHRDSFPPAILRLVEGAGER